jgi:hypothetical protein
MSGVWSVGRTAVRAAGAFEGVGVPFGFAQDDRIQSVKMIIRSAHHGRVLVRRSAFVQASESWLGVSGERLFALRERSRV